MDLGLPPYDNVYQATMRKAVQIVGWSALMDFKG